MPISLSLFRPGRMKPASAFILSMTLGACTALGLTSEPETPSVESATVSAAADARQTAARPPWRLAGRAMAAAADPRAVDAAITVLEKGGSAVDAAIAAHAVLGLVEPQSSGIGGGAFMLVFDRASGTLTAYDGRETAPASASPDMFLAEDGSALPFVTAWQSGLSVGAPGQVALYEAAYRDHGKAVWASLFAPAARLAKTGFVVSPRLAELLATPRLRDAVQLDDLPDSSAYFYPGGEPLKAGDLRKNPAYAALMLKIAQKGADAFYEGKMPTAIAAAVAGHPRPGRLSAPDVSAYEVVKREAVCGPFRSYKVCSAPPPSSGAVAMSEILGLYERFSRSANLAGTAALRAFVDAQRLAYADRDHYVADQDHVMVPYKELIDPAYLDARAKQRAAPGSVPSAGDPGAVLSGKPIIDMWGRDATQHAPGTTHLSVVDFEGNAVAMTATIEAPFGSSIFVPEGGFLLNNELTDFAFAPEENGKPVANAVAPLKRPRSSMSPTIVLDKTGDMVMAAGSPGGNSIIAYTAKTLLGVLEWGDDAQAAIDRPNVIARGKTVKVEVGAPGGPDIAETLRQADYDVTESQGEASGLHVIVARRFYLEGGADRRREGKAVEIVRSLGEPLMPSGHD